MHMSYLIVSCISFDFGRIKESSIHNILVLHERIKTKKKHKFCASFVLNIKRYNSGAYSISNGCEDILEERKFQGKTNRFIIINH